MFMASSSFLFSFLRLLFVILTLTLTPNPTSSNLVYHQCLDDYGFYTSNSTYQSNLNAILPKLTSDTHINYGFYNLSYGQASDRAYALGLCRGDVKPEACRRCLNNSTTLLPQLCPDQKDSVGGYDECMLRYSDSENIFGIQLFRHFTICLSNDTSASDWDKFSGVLKDLLERLRKVAAKGGSVRKFAAGSAEGWRSRSIYGYAECLPALSESECNDCVIQAVSEMAKAKCGWGKIGGRIIKQSCSFRYEDYRFYDGSIIAYGVLVPSQQASHPSPSPSPRYSTPSARGKKNKSMVVWAIVVPTFAFVGLLIFVCIYLRVRKQRKEFQNEGEAEVDSIHQLQFTFETIRVATDNFSNENKLGQGGFGPVYKGRLANGEEIAVKRLSKSSTQGEIEFKNEVLIMSKLQHRNLVKLLGFCFQKEERLLFYEFLPNKSLDYFIFDPNKRPHLNWEKRYQIIEGIARGLLYLHEDSQQSIIHRDLKASNILLDAELNPKISDFGMARLLDQTQAKTNKIAGTYGYMAPEYAIHGKFSVKSDVFSFGILILEIISGQKNGGFRNGENVEHLPSFAWKNFRRGSSSIMVDITLNDRSRYEIMRCIHIGLLCVQKSVDERPTLPSIVLMLSNNSLFLPKPLQPAFFMDNNTRISSEEEEEEKINSNIQVVSVYEASITEPYPR